MKKRVVTEDQYPTKPWVFRYLTEEEREVRLVARKKYTDSNKYSAKDFPKLRTYVILVKVLKTGVYYAYCDDTTTNGYPVAASRCTLFRASPRHHGDRSFTLKTLRDDYNGYRRVKHWFDKNMPYNLRDKSKYDMFISRVGSKNCPIKVKIKPHLKNQVRASFTVR